MPELLYIKDAELVDSIEARDRVPLSRGTARPLTVSVEMLVAAAAALVGVHFDAAGAADAAISGHESAYNHGNIHPATTVSGAGIELNGQDLILSIGTGSDQVAAGDHGHTSDQITETVSRVFVSPTEKTEIAHANRSALDSVQGINTGDQDLSGLVPATRTINSKPLTANITLTSADVGADPAGSATSTLNAAKSYADGLVVGLIDDRGNYNASGNTYPVAGGSGTSGAILKGDLWIISGAGTLGGVSVEIGDQLRALVDAPGQTATNWAISQANIGYVAENSSNKVTSFSAPTDTQYPSAKLVSDQLATKQPLDATLTALAVLSTAANKLLYATGPDQFTTTDLTAFARTLLAVVDAAAGRTALGAAADAEVVKLTGDQIVAGNKTFSGTVVAKQLIITNDGATTDVNNIGVPGLRGFGVGICPGPLPSGMEPLSSGTFDKYHDDYGNYIYSDGSIMCWIPAYYYKWGTGSNGLAVNAIDIKPLSYFTDEATANASGYAIERAFYDGGSPQKGVFVDKFICSNNGGTASSIRNGNPLSSNVAHNPFSGLTGAPANYYYGAVGAAKTRGTNYFCCSRFIFAMLARLAYAHAQASTSTAYCGWYHTTNNFPKGCNNNALRDTNDTSVIYVSDGYSNCGKTGSANYFNRTTHNGQNSGVADLNGNMWEITPGLTSDGTNLYILNTSVAMKNVTGGNTLATDLWGATGIAALYTSLGTTYQSLTDSDTVKSYGSTSQVFSAATSGNDWAAAGLGIPLQGGTGGTNAFGNDYLGDYAPSGRTDLCPLSGGNWDDSSSAGVWAFLLDTVRGSSSSTVGFRSALYL